MTERFLEEDYDLAHLEVTPGEPGGSKLVDLPVLHGSMGPPALDIRQLYSGTECFTYDPGYTSTASCESKITFIDGQKGVLLHRGYPIEELAEQSTFLEVAYLLMEGDLPNKEVYHSFTQSITLHTMVHEQLRNFYSGFRRDAHPMAIIVGVVGALSAFYHDSLDIHDPAQCLIASHRLIAKMPTIAAMAYKVNPIVAKALEKILILHADHEQNASTSTVRLAGSTGANPFACAAAGIACLWGPAHGGANEAVVNMLKEIGHKDRITEYIKRAKDRNDPFRLMGFGHRIYKNYDPRATVLRKACQEVLAELGYQHEPLLELAMELEKIALEDPYFVEKKLYPNVDFYSGIIFKAMGIPTSMFTVLFAVARTVGWIAQWMEMIGDPTQKIGRPRQLYTGHILRHYTSLAGRRS